MVSRLDQVYRSVVLTKFFNDGWGSPENFRKLFNFRKSLSDRDVCQHLVDYDHQVVVDKIEDEGDYRLVNAHFQSPFAKHLPGLLPLPAETAYFQILLPRIWKTNDRPVCIHMAGTGDHHFWRRRNLIAKPLLKDHGIASILLENPFYGLRKPKNQKRSCLRNVTDLFIMGGSLMLEGLVLLRWCEKQGRYFNGWAHAATTWPYPIALVPCLSWSTASGVFTQGVMSSSIAWKTLEKQYYNTSVYAEEIAKMMIPIDNGTQKEPLLSSPTIAETINKVPTPTASSHLLQFRKLFKESASGGVLKNLSSHLSSPKSILDIVPGHGILDDGNTVVYTKDDVSKPTIEFMKAVMDECTHLKNFAMPIDPELIICVAATRDGYVPRTNTMPIDDIWPNCKIRYVDSGHISAYLLHQADFRAAIVDAINYSRQKYSSIYGSKVDSKPNDEIKSYDCPQDDINNEKNSI